MKLDPPSNDMKLQLLQEIAAESGLDWDSKALENKLFKESAYDKVLFCNNPHKLPKHLVLLYGNKSKRNNSVM